MTQEKGLTTAIFNVSQGTVKIYLPDDIRQGDMISGTVTVIPEGRNEKQIQRNMAELARYGIVFNGQKFGFDQASPSFRFLVSAVNSPQSSIALLSDKESNPVQQLIIPAKPLNEQKPAPVQCVIPGHVLTGSPMNIPGPFDGNAGNTQCSVGNQPATILAESPRSCIVAFPANATGMQQTQVQENGQQPCSKNVSGVEMNVLAGKLNLTRGENTYIEVSITGLQNLEQTATLSLINLTAETVTLLPSNNIVIPLEPSSVSSGSFNQRFDVQSLKTGTFTCNVKLDFGDIMLSPKPPDTVLADEKKVPTISSGERLNPLPLVPDVPKMPVDSIPDKNIKSCTRSTGEDKLPRMDGGLTKGKMKAIQVIKRDDFIPLIAEGADFDMFIIQCSIAGTCPEVNTVRIVPLSGRVRFEWEIVDGPGYGQFVKLGCSYSNNHNGLKTEGEQVIFMPPFVELPVTEKEASVTSKIKLSIIDDKESLKDDQVDRIYDIVTTRSIKNPDEYKIEIRFADDDHVLPTAVSKQAKGKCEAVKGAWKNVNDLKPSTINLPDAPDNKKLLLGQLIVLEAEDQRDMDLLPGINCITDCSVILPFSRIFEDNVQWSWEATGSAKGTFVFGNAGRYVIYKMPDKMADGKTIMDVSFRVKVYNPDGTQAKDGKPNIDDPSSPLPIWSDAVKVMVYQPGVKLSQSPAKFLPTGNNSVDIISQLMIKDKEWIPAPAHSCRIHYFDLVNVSNEIGVCMNSPKPAEANFCRDLKIINEKEQEAFDTVKQVGCPDNTGYFMQARTKKPVQSYTISIHSEDFASWGFLRSFANVNEDINDDKGQSIKPYNPLLKPSGTTPEELKNYTHKLQAYLSELATYYDLKEKNRKEQLPYYESIPETMVEAKQTEDIEFIDLKTQKTFVKTVTKDKKTEYTDNRVTIPLDIDENLIPDIGWIIETANSRIVDDKLKIEGDFDNDPVGDGWWGDGLSVYEEYRGFMVSKPKEEHRRTNPNKKDLFVDNKDDLPIEEFVRITGLAVHQISENQYGGINEVEFKALKNIVNNHRFINFNSGIAHVTAQKGLYLRNETIPNEVVGEELLGITPSEQDLKQKKVYPAPPNWNLAVRVDKAKISRLYNGPAFDKKLAQIVAHELCHSVNVAHHGEKGQDPGLFSGDKNCIMRYEGLKEVPGTALCTLEVGAHKGRGSCAFQIRISGRKNPDFAIRGYPIRQ